MSKPGTGSGTDDQSCAFCFVGGHVLTDFVHSLDEVAPAVLENIKARKDLWVPLSHSVDERIDKLELVFNDVDRVARQAHSAEVELDAIVVARFVVQGDQTTVGPLFTTIVWNVVILVLQAVEDGLNGVLGGIR